MDEAVINRTLRNLARSDRADHIPRIGALVAMFMGLVVYFYVWTGTADNLIAVLAGCGAALIVAAIFVLVAWPYVRWRHHKLMRERALFLFPPGRDNTRWALERLLALREDLAADPSFARLLARLQAMPEYERDFDRAERQRQRQLHEQLATTRRPVPPPPPPHDRREEARPLAVMRPRAGVPRPSADDSMVAPPHDDPDRDIALDIDRTAELRALRDPAKQKGETGHHTGGHAIPLELPDDERKR